MMMYLSKWFSKHKKGFTDVRDEDSDELQEGVYVDLMRMKVFD